jgi:hypothetical protein
MNTLVHTSIERSGIRLLANSLRTSISALVLTGLALAGSAVWPPKLAAPRPSPTPAGEDRGNNNSAAEIDPNLVLRNKEDKIESVRYNAINVMLLNEFLKEHKAFIEEQDKLKGLGAELTGLVSTVRVQAAQIEKVSAQVQMNNPRQSLARNIP